MTTVTEVDDGRSSGLNQLDTTSDRRSARRALWTIARNSRASLINRALLLAVTLVALDCLIVARFQPEPALALVRHTPPVTLFVGVFLHVAPLLASYVIAASLVGLAMYGADGWLSKATVGAVTATATFVVSNAVFDARFTWSDVKFFGWSAFALAIAIVLNRAIGRGMDEGIPTMMLVVGLGVVAASLATDPAIRRLLERPFMPPERFELIEPGSDEFVGYLLDIDESGQWTTVLVEETRHVIVIPSQAVATRTICALDDSWQAPRRPVVEVSDHEVPLC